MADITISGPGSVIAKAASDVLVAVMDYAGKVRESESQTSRDEEDHIRFQAYWDYRAVLEFLHLVGPKLPWPPAATPVQSK